MKNKAINLMKVMEIKINLNFVRQKKETKKSINKGREEEKSINWNNKINSEFSDFEVELEDDCVFGTVARTKFIVRCLSLSLSLISIVVRDKDTQGTYR